MDTRRLPLDRISSDALAASGLRYGLVDGSDRDALAAWDEADSRGFHDRRPDPEAITEHSQHVAHRRITGVWDDGIPDPHVPVATVASWVGALSTPGGSVPSWAISSVTVAPTHRRRGVARALLEGELRTAAAAGIPMASLTVSEATIYGRFGFGPATLSADLSVETKRAGWVPAASGDNGRLAFVSPQIAYESCRGLVDRAAAGTPGDFEIDDYHWGRLVGHFGDRDKRSASIRVVRYDDAAGEPQGVVAYRMVADKTDFTKHTVEIDYIRAATDDAYAALWKYLLELDLVTNVRYDVASADEPVLWMIRDQRAARVATSDHHWLRILDVKAALEARTYGAPGALTLGIDDRLGTATGVYRLEVAADGSAEVSTTDDAPDLTLDVASLSALYLGAWRASTFVHAARLVERTDGAASRLDAMFRSPETPLLSFWY
ncbi:GNAT family N-acetyltransferase [Planctomonas sp. JC2975]|uniref:GNAT family N-acetyltransferase n=1 Tax=Planctomonas sp. JC2975 TaxID=2729626 RepID=UPI001473F85A|nr:GNAT family N-acetyltransferase [Planctomonas sp. JC2975]NNC13015.1 GNAT family N-acetyltransferase [Planctomonas sp. JC2975]